MVKKKSAILAILVIFLFTLTAVSAGENVTDDAIAENAHEDVEINLTQTAGTFTELNTSISRNPENTMLVLGKDYENEGNWNYINIDKSMAIDGQGHSIDAKSLSRVFRITGSVVMIKNITFLNGKYDDYYGGAIFLASGSSLQISYCNFINCSAESGGALYCEDSSYLEVYDSNFVNCSAQFGGAIYYGSDTVSYIYDSNFTDNVAEVIGGSLFSGGGYKQIKRSNFKRSIARYESGGAFTFLDTYFDGDYLTVSDCWSEFGGAVTLLSSLSNITNSIFTKNTALYDGGAIYAAYEALYLEGNQFSQNSAQRGGAAFISLIATEISHNQFTENTAAAGNAVYALTVNDLADMSTDNYGAQLSDFIKTVNNNLTITGSDYYQFRYRPVNITSLPAYYSLDDENLLTPVKDQGTEGNCWAFAAMAALESCILKASGLAMDLSEANLKNLMALYSSYGYVIPVNDGGHDEMVYGYLASWLGPIFESDDTYYINDYLSPLLKSILHIQNIAVFNRTDFTDNDEIKKAIIQYGAVATGMYYNDTYIINETSYYYDGNETGNHAVCIVGWDDSYSRYNFNVTPQGDGAWIVRNSWGPSWGDGGYFYVSYYDTVFAQVNKSGSYTFILNDTVSLDRVYQFEVQEITYLTFETLNQAKYKNVFTAEGDEYLAAASTIFVEECDYKLEIFVNGNSKITKTGRAKQGYYTVYLDDYIYLNSGDKVEVVFDCTNFKHGLGKFAISSQSDCTNLYTESGISYYWNNVEWVDIGETGAVVCIKMFTKFTNDHKISPYLDLSLDIDTADGGYVLEVIAPQDAVGNVSIAYGQNEYLINLSNQNTVKLFNLHDGDIISARYLGDDIYSENTASMIVDTNISTVGTFDDFTDKIRLAKDGGVLIITKDYANELADDEIIIRKAITIDGQGHSINANHLSRIFNIQSDNVVIKNINLIAGYHNETGSALLILGANCSIVNCTFTDSLSKGGATICCFANNTRISNSTFTGNSGFYGSAIDFESCRATVDDCKFKDNHADEVGAIAAFNSFLKVTNSFFENNTASSHGGAIYLFESECEISQSSFSENHASNGGAILMWVSKTEFVNCSFEDNNASNRGGAIYCENSTHIFKNCSFTRNQALYGGAVYSRQGNDSFVDCNFTENIASENGGALCLWSENCIIDGCVFERNNARNAGALYWNCNGGTVVNSVFKSNFAVAFGGAVIWYFTGNISDSHFKNNRAGTFGGAVCWYGDDGILMNSTFTDNPDAVMWVGDNGNLINSTFENNINSTQIYWDNDHSGTISGCRFINSTRNNVEKGGAVFTRRDADPHGDDTTFTFNSPQTIQVVLNGVLYDLPITSDFIFNFTKAGESKSYRVNSTSIYDELFDLDAGEWRVNVIFEGDDNYDAFDCGFALTVNPAVSVIKVNDTATFKGHETEIAAAVLDADGRPINEGTVIFYEGDSRIETANVIEGIAKITYIPQAGGKYTINAFYESGNYVKSNASANLTVESASIEITLQDGKVGFTSTLNANVTQIYSIANAGKVTFYIDEEYIDEVSLSQGSASLDYVPLKAGNHVIRAVYSYDSNFIDAENSTSYYVEMADSSLTLDDVNGTVNHGLTLTAHVTSSNGLKITDGKVKFMNGNDVIGTVDVKEGVAQLTYRPSKDGEHTITAFYESDNYVGSQDDAKVFIDSLSLELVADPATVGITSNFVVNVKGLYSVINEGSITFYLNGNHIGKKDVSNGVVTLDYTPMTSGSFTLKAVYSESDRFSDNETFTTYKVSKASSQVLINDVRGSVASEITLTARVIGPNSLPISEGTVTFKNGNDVIGIAEVKNGAASIIYTPAKAGTYQITASFEAANYNPSSNASQASIEKANTRITFDSIESVYYKSPTSFAVTVSSNGKAVGEGSVVFYINDQQIYASALQNGRVTFDYTFASAGAYEITAAFGETANYNPSNQKATFTVMKLPTAIASSDITTIYNTGGELTVTLKDKNNSPLANVAISIDSRAYSTDSNGQVKISTKGWNPSTYVLPIGFDGSTNYDRSTSSVKVTVLKATPKLSASKKTFKRKVKTKKYTVTLKTNLNTPLAKMKVSIKINGKTFKATTAASGKATFKIKKLTKKGTYKSTVTFAGNAQYNKITKKVKITVK